MGLRRHRRSVPVGRQHDAGHGHRRWQQAAHTRPLPRLTVAYEEWAPTIPAAMRVLRPAGVSLVRRQVSVDNTDPSAAERPSLPFRNCVFDVVVNRHECFLPADVYRILRSGGVFVAEQVGRDQSELRGVFGRVPAQLDVRTSPRHAPGWRAPAWS